MNLWLIVLIIAIVAMVVGPIMMLQPNSLQRAQENLRSRAYELGLRVSMVSLPRQATDAVPPDVIPVYCLPHETAKPNLVEWLLLRTSYAHEAHFMKQWQWHGEGRGTEAEQARLQQLLPELPVSVVAVGEGPKGFCFYWTEQGGVAQLERLKSLLMQFRQNQ